MGHAAEFDALFLSTFANLFTDSYKLVYISRHKKIRGSRQKLRNININVYLVQKVSAVESTLVQCEYH